MIRIKKILRIFSLSKKGDTLAEALIAVLIIGICLISIVASFFGGLVFFDRMKELSAAILSAQEKMEAIRNMPFNNILALPATFNDPADFLYLRSPTGTIAVTDMSGTAPSNMAQVTVTVSWTSRQGGTLSRSLSALITRGGIDKQ